jgi:erythronate-4-phosphate dehydrogenase
VWESEPHIDPKTLQQALLATPHIAGYSQQGKANATSMGVNALARYFNLPLTEWRPTEVSPTTPRLLSWEELCETIDEYCPIAEETRILKSNPELFESLRNNYTYREEYF